MSHDSCERHDGEVPAQPSAPSSRSVPATPREEYLALRRASNVLALIGLLLGLTAALVVGIALDEPLGSKIGLALVAGALGALIGKLPLALVRFALRRF